LKPSPAFLCIITAWILLVGYSILLTSVIESIIEVSNVTPPDEKAEQIIVFLYGLAVVSFLGGSQIPAVFLKKRSFTVQFGFSATFGLMLLTINVLHDTSLSPVREAIKPFFVTYPVIALEYLSIPYFFMIFIDLYLSGRLHAFSWTRFREFLTGTFLHPRRTFQHILRCQSTLFALGSTLLVALTWIARNVAFSSTDFVPARWRFLSCNFGDSLGLVSEVTLVIPSVLLTWLTVSVLIHAATKRLGGRGQLSNLMSLSGFAFLPSLAVVAVDLAELGLNSNAELVPSTVFFFAGFAIPLVVWPLLLAAVAAQKSETVTFPKAIATTALTFLPFVLLLARIFL
jgi:hypothetical protein